MASSSSSSSKSWKYDVFLSFRGRDTRKTFVDHLYYALEQHGIRTYKDDVTLARGDTISPSLMKAIESSQISVIIFSKNYADSSWCLDELSHIMKCGDSETGQIVMPIFYHVDPSDVRKQKGKYAKAFAKHELSENGRNKVETWKKALFDASNIAGWEPKQVANGHEAKCIKEIVGSILDILSSSDSTVEDENLVGMGIRLKQLKSQLKIWSSGVRMVGIWGLGGGGKTTLATCLYKKFSPNFDGCCFLGNIREETKQHGLRSLQEKILSTVFGKQMQVESVELGKDKIKQLLCHRKVLIVLDDVDHLNQLEALAGYHRWFGDGSRVIITTRDRQLLTAHRVDVVSPISLLSREEAIRLFRRHAYHEDNVVQDYEELSLRVITYVNGLPLALKILGAFLYGKDKDEWISTLARLKDHPEMDIVEILKISYDGLKHVEKELFLDIACFHIGKNENEAMEILDACGFHPRIGVKVLIQKALMTVSEGEFAMHDLLQEMAHYIVRGKHPNNPEKHSRLWRREDIEDIGSGNATMENDKIEAIIAGNFNSPWCPVHVPKMKKLRFLKMHAFVEGPIFLSNELRYIDWIGLDQFPESFQLRKLVVLKLQRNLQEELWKGCQYLPSLKELELVDARKLVRTPDFGGLPCLQKLTLKKCYSLVEIHESLGNHNSLVYISVSHCNKLKRFSRGNFHALKCLENFILIGCKQLNIQQLILARCLRKLDLSWCNFGEVPKEVGELSSLQELHLRGSHFRRLYISLSRLTSLKLLNLSDCKNLVELPELPSSLAILKADWCDSLEAIIRDTIHINCKCLCDVSIKKGLKNIIGGERLLETMLQGNLVESGCIRVRLEGFEILRWFAPSFFVRGGRCRMQLPENWYHHFSGFLFITAADLNNPPTISMKHENLESGSRGPKSVVENELTWSGTWVGYISFGSLRNTLWWDQTSLAIEFKFYSRYRHDISVCGCMLIPKRRETITDSSSFDDVYTCGLNILDDSKSTLECRIKGSDINKLL